MINELLPLIEELYNINDIDIIIDEDDGLSSYIFNSKKDVDHNLLIMFSPEYIEIHYDEKIIFKLYENISDTKFLAEITDDFKSKL